MSNFLFLLPLSNASIKFPPATEDHMEITLYGDIITQTE